MYIIYMSISNSSTRYGMVWQRQQVDVEKERWSGRNIIITHRSTVPSSRTTSTTIQPQIHKIHNMRKCIKLKYTTWSLPTIPSSSTTNTTNSQLLFSSNLDTQIQRTVRPNTNTHVHTEIQLQVQWEQDKHYPPSHSSQHNRHNQPRINCSNPTNSR